MPFRHRKSFSGILAMAALMLALPDPIRAQPVVHRAAPPPEAAASGVHGGPAHGDPESAMRMDGDAGRPAEASPSADRNNGDRRPEPYAVEDGSWARLAEWPAATGEHLPLAWFSLGSWGLAGLLYGIQESAGRSPGTRIVGDIRHMRMAIGAASLTGLVAGVSYLYFRREPPASRPWNLSLETVESSRGSYAAAAVMRLPFADN